MPSLVFENNARDAMGDALNALLDDGVLELYDGAVLVVAFTLPDAASNTSINGVITFGSIAQGTAVGDGPDVDIAKFWTNGKGALVATADIGLTTDSPTVVLDNTNILTNQKVNVNSAVLTVPAGT